MIRPVRGDASGPFACGIPRPEPAYALRPDPTVILPRGILRRSVASGTGDTPGVDNINLAANYGGVLAGEWDDDDAATRDAARASRPAPVEVLVDRGGGCARLPGGVSYTDVGVVGS